MRAGAILLMVAMSGCAAKPAPDDGFGDLAGVDTKSDYFSYRLKLVGTLPGGQSLTVPYSSRPRFRGVTLPGFAGLEVDVWVRSTDGGDAVAWLLDGSFDVIAKNDDADDTTYDSHVHAVLPASKGDTYYLVFRDYSLKRHTFTLAYTQTRTKPRATVGDSGTTPEAQAFLPLYQAAAGAYDGDSHVVANTTAPASVRAGVQQFLDAADAGVQPIVWKFRAAGQNAWAVMMVNSGTYYVSLFDAAGTWVSHGAADENGDRVIDWSLNIDDPTLCRCGLAPDGSGYAGCEWVDGNRYGSDISDCD